MTGSIYESRRSELYITTNILSSHSIALYTSHIQMVVRIMLAMLYSKGIYFAADS
jgi:hypothetical protein